MYYWTFQADCGLGKTYSKCVKKHIGFFFPLITLINLLCNTLVVIQVFY